MKNKQTEIQATIEKRNIYKDEDSGIIFLFATVAPILLAFLVSFVVSSIAQGREVKTDVITSNIGYEIAYCILQTAMFLLIFYYYNKNRKISLKAANINFKMKWQTYLILIAIGVISLLGIQYFIGMFDNFLKVVGYPFEQGLTNLNPTSWWKYILAIIFLALAPAIYEELLFRGVILNGLRTRFNDYIAIVISAAMFALMHQSLQQLVYPFILGCIMGWIVLRTGSCVSSFIVHFTNNFLVVTFTYLQNATGFSFALADTWWFYIVALVLFAVTAGIYFLVDRFYFHHKSAFEVEKTSKKTSKFLYISLAAAGLLYIVAVVTKIAIS